MADDPEPRLVVAVCVYWLEHLRARWKHNMAQLDNDEFLVVLDRPADEPAVAIAEEIRKGGGSVIIHDATLGVSAARNSALSARPRSLILFVDDDVLLSRQALDEIRHAFAEGAHVVGGRLVPPVSISQWPWYFTEGQAHLVGWHATGAAIKTWGACMGIDAAFAHRHNLTFDSRFGRLGKSLMSGEDTNFVNAMVRAGGVERLLSSVQVVHDVDSSRLTVRYLIRRAYWQGRTEVRRREVISGLKKEWRRYRRGKRIWISLGYLAALVVGMGHEFVAAGRG
jgi:glycosyltransferase involved in cell wall biosynthesis